MSDNMYFMGIDPGKKGSISIIDKDRNIIFCNRIPIIMLKKPELDIKELCLMIDNFSSKYFPLWTTIEKSQAMPGQGVTSMFSYGYGYGLLIGILSAIKVPFAEVHPRTWTTQLFKGISGQGKDRCYASASQIFPNWNPKYKYEKDWADSLLIAEYGRRIHNNEK